MLQSTVFTTLSGSELRTCRSACLGEASNVFVECQFAVQDDTEALHCRQRLDDSTAYCDMWHVVDTITSVTTRELNHL